MIHYTVRGATLDDASALADTVIKPIVTVMQGRVPDQCLSWLTKEESIANWQRWFLEAEAGDSLHVAELPTGQVVGCALGGPQKDDPPYTGELYLLGVLPAYQGHGIGKLLVRFTATRLFQHGIEAMRICVLRANPNRAFYEHLGGQYVREQPYEWNGVMLTEVVYGWKDLTALLLV